MRLIEFPLNDVDNYFDNYFRVHLARYFLSPAEFLAHHNNKNDYYFKGNNINTPILNIDRRVGKYSTINVIPGYDPLQCGNYIYFSQNGIVKYQDGYTTEYDNIYNEYYSWIDDRTKYNFIFIALIFTHATIQETWEEVSLNKATNLGCGLMDLPKFSETNPFRVLKLAKLSIYEAEKTNLLRALEVVAPFYINRISQYIRERNHPNGYYITKFMNLFSINLRHTYTKLPYTTCPVFRNIPTQLTNQLFYTL